MAWFCIGKIELSHTSSGLALTVKDVDHLHNLRGPFRVKTWWNYNFADTFGVEATNKYSYTDYETKSYRGKTLIWLELTDVEGIQIRFFESIGLSDKTTEPHPYEHLPPTSSAPVIEVQNVNKLHRFLIQYQSTSSIHL